MLASADFNHPILGNLLLETLSNQTKTFFIAVSSSQSQTPSPLLQQLSRQAQTPLTQVHGNLASNAEVLQNLVKIASKPWISDCELFLNTLEYNAATCERIGVYKGMLITKSHLCQSTELF